MTSFLINNIHPQNGTVRNILEHAVLKIGNHDIENPRYEAEQILSDCLKLESWRLYAEPRRSLTPGEQLKFRRKLKKRLDHYPLAYIRGWTGFYNLILKTDKRGLIPRPETEILVDRALITLNQISACNPQVADLGCGAGGIALAMIEERPNILLRASDISRESLDLAEENAKNLGLIDRIIFRQGDLFQPWEDFRGNGFDMIVSNPPYLTERELASAPPEVVLHEPVQALYGGPDGLTVIRALIRESPNYLNSGGWLIFEIGAEQGNAVRRLLDQTGKMEFAEITKDYSGRDRVVAAYKL